jgi:hypothetical protein
VPSAIEHNNLRRLERYLKENGYDVDSQVYSSTMPSLFAVCYKNNLIYGDFVNEKFYHHQSISYNWEGILALIETI